VTKLPFCYFPLSAFHQQSLDTRMLIDLDGMWCVWIYSNLVERNGTLARIARSTDWGRTLSHAAALKGNFLPYTPFLPIHCFTWWWRGECLLPFAKWENKRLPSLHHYFLRADETEVRKEGEREGKHKYRFYYGIAFQLFNWVIHQWFCARMNLFSQSAIKLAKERP